MARTKQTAIKRSRGQKAPRKNLTTRAHRAHAPGGIKHRTRLRSGVNALREIRKCQKSTRLLMTRAPFIRVARAIGQEVGDECRPPIQVMWAESAMQALQDAAEDYMCSMFEDAQLCTFHAGRVTLMPQDILLAMRLRDGYYPSTYKSHRPAPADRSGLC